MNKHEYINQLISVWGEEYVYDLIDRGYSPVEVSDGNGRSEWKLLLTQDCACATLAKSRPAVSPVSAGNG